MMRFYLAPLEGITGYIYRNALEECFPGTSTYFTPFLAPGQKGNFSHREREDILPLHNAGMHVIPQILTNKADDFLKTCDKLQELGYDEVNLNLGCPSRTVVTKYRGAGFLAKPVELEMFLDEVFKRAKVRISIKTRIGKDSRDEWPEILAIFRQFPIEELIVHPRLQIDYYKNSPDWEAFGQAREKAPWNVCYNGDLVSCDDLQKFSHTFPGVDRVMIGRGVLRNPGLIPLLQTGQKPSREKLRKFHDLLYLGYRETIPGERNVLFKMKEVWVYMHTIFQGGEKLAKRIKKAERLDAYEDAVEALFTQCDIHVE